MGFSDFFASSCETRELHRDEQLRTRYYRNRFEHCQEALETFAKQEGMTVESVDRVHGEIFLIGPRFECIATVSQLTPLETGIDLKVNYPGAGWGKPKKTVLAIYRHLNSALQFKGVSLHP
ncbi:MAG TPA: hypothetical protein PLZ76_01755 [Bacillota bacterium]|nr:hypothetical protein [Bacillota bacterium]